MSYSYSYPRPAFTADCILFCLTREDIKVLLVQRKNPPFQGCWAFPGGFVEEGETVECCAARELHEETGLTNIPLHQFQTFSTPERDPRGWTVTTAFFACVCRDVEQRVIAGDDAAYVRWCSLHHIPPLAFDHQQILEKALCTLRKRMAIEPLAFDFLNRFFTFDDADVLMSQLFGTQKDTFDWLERMQKLRIVRVHNADIPSFIFDEEAYQKASEETTPLLI